MASTSGLVFHGRFNQSWAMTSFGKPAIQSNASWHRGAVDANQQPIERLGDRFGRQWTSTRTIAMGLPMFFSCFRVFDEGGPVGARTGRPGSRIKVRDVGTRQSRQKDSHRRLSRSNRMRPTQRPRSRERGYKQTSCSRQSMRERG